MKDFYSTLLAEASQEEANNKWLTQIREAPLEEIRRSLEDGLVWEEW